MSAYSRVLVVAAHADDETLGCGGYMRRLADEGAQVRVIFLADGVGSRDGAGPDPRALAEREDCAHAALGRLGAKALAFHRLPDNRLDTVALLDVVRCIEEAKAQLAPELVLTHHPHDLNVDHRVAALATVTAFRPKPGEFFREVLAFEVPSASDWGACVAPLPFSPDTYVDVTATLDAKLAAYQAYRGEVPEDPHARSLEAVRIIAEMRGRQCGAMAAEAYVTLRRILRPR